MGNDSIWYCPDCGETFCGNCDRKNITDDFVELCDECYNGLDEEPSQRTEGDSK